MSYGKGEQIENAMDHKYGSGKRQDRGSNKQNKVTKHRIERRRAKADPECDPHYRRYKGWVW